MNKDDDQGELAKAGPRDDRPTRRSESFWSWIRLTARLWGFVLFVLLIIVVFRNVILPFVIALLLTYVLAPLLKRFEQVSFAGRKMPRIVSLLILYGILLGLIGIFFTVFVPQVSRDLARIVREAPKLSQQLKRHWLPSVERWANRRFSVDGRKPLEKKTARRTRSMVRIDRAKNGESFIIRPIGMSLDVEKTSKNRWTVRTLSHRDVRRKDEGLGNVVERYIHNMVAMSENEANRLVRIAQRFVVGLFEAVTAFVLVLMISAFLLMDREKILAWIRNLVPVSHHDQFDEIARLIDRALTGAIRGQLLICLVNGLLTGIGLFLFDVNYALLLALFAGVLSLIPIFGSILSSIPIVLIALISGDQGLDLLRGMMVLLWIVGIHLLEANFLNPKIIGTAVRVHPVFVIFAVVAGQRTFGVVGALLAVPIVSSVQAMLVYLRGQVRGITGATLPRISR